MLRLLILAGLLAACARPSHAQVKPGRCASDARGPAGPAEARPARHDAPDHRADASSTGLHRPRPTVPIAPNSLGAEVLMGASGFLNHLSSEVIAAFGAVRSVPLLWRWLTVMATDPWHAVSCWIRPGAWRWCWLWASGRMGMRRAMRRPILAPGPPGAAMAARRVEEDAEARAERGETEPPQRRADRGADPAAPCAAGARPLVLELLPVLAFLVVGHLLAATALGGEDPAAARPARGDRRLRALCVAILCIARVMFSPRSAAAAPAGHP